MKLENAVGETQLYEAKIKKLLLLDIDDTIVSARNIYIYKKMPNGREMALTPEEFSKENVNSETNHLYDFREFRDAELVKNSIHTGEPILHVLQYMDHMITKGYKIGILTARGMEPVIRDTLQSWLMYKKRGKLRAIGAKLKEVFAISDEIKNYDGDTSFARKANVIKSLVKKYHKIIFIDDDMKNIDAVNDLRLHGVVSKHIDNVTF